MLLVLNRELQRLLWDVCEDFWVVEDKLLVVHGRLRPDVVLAVE